MVQGIPLISLNEMPDRLRSVFKYPLFNAVQSKCFPIAYKCDDNLVVSAPTGGGKTAILEMAICRLINGFKTDQYKIVYMAPTKSLCSERQRDWQAKFTVLDLTCAELTGDTDQGHLRNVQSANIVITTPEKWDSMTRKWKDHARLMQLVKLFFIDEVHILKDSRGATLEAVVSRMKSVGSNVRFVALSATVPNSEDIATWLGKNHTCQHLPATLEKFGEEFRPVRLQKHVVGLSYKGNDFGFESACDPKLPGIIGKYSHKKPIMIFCITRKSATNTAKLLANVWATKGPRDRHWEGPTQRLIVQDPELKSTLTSGVAFHHAGLEGADRHTVENGFLEGQINVICCTSTLAVGVNLPCHMVMVKNTVSYQDDAIKEYADLEIMQMLGRAGRPQFDSTAIAVIITKQEKVKKYERLVSGEELLESCLHLNLIDHLNAEIGLGTIYNLYTAKRWLAGTFLSVRLRLNPEHYKLDDNAVTQNLDHRIEHICRRDLELLEQTQLITSSDRLKATEFGDAMARYFVKFQSMQIFMRLQPRSKMSDILSAIAQAEEFRDVRLRVNEKKLFKEINRASGIKFPIKVDIAMHAHKRSLIIQSELGGVDFPADEQYVKHKRQFLQDKAILLSTIHRLICCVVDCQIHLQDAVAARHALELARSFCARVWDNSPYQMKQIAQIGVVAIRKLALGGISSIEALESAEPHRIEMLMSKNPPFGNKLQGNLRDFPKLRVSVKMTGKYATPGRPVIIKIKAECGFMNDAIPLFFHRRPVYICLLTERSDGCLVDFRRIR
ncbi:putative DEAD/DEAH box DNA helicase [Usnea florida]